MSVLPDPYKAERERDRIHRENMAAFNEGLKTPPWFPKRQSSGGSSRGYSGDGTGFLGLLGFGAAVYASSWIRAQYFPGGDPIYRTLTITMVLGLMVWFGLWIFGRLFRSRMVKVLLVIVVVSVWYFSAGGNESALKNQRHEDGYRAKPTSPIRVPVGSGSSGPAVSPLPYSPASSIGDTSTGNKDVATINPEPVHVSGEIKRPSKVRDVKPQYPAIAQSARVQGVVVIEAVIGPDGRVREARVLRSVPLLDQAALDAVRQWEYSPTIFNGLPVPVTVTINVNFRLDEG